MLLEKSQTNKEYMFSVCSSGHWPAPRRCAVPSWGESLRWKMWRRLSAAPLKSTDVQLWWTSWLLCLFYSCCCSPRITLLPSCAHVARSLLQTSSPSDPPTATAAGSQTLVSLSAFRDPKEERCVTMSVLMSWIWETLSRLPVHIPTCGQFKVNNTVAPGLSPWLGGKPQSRDAIVIVLFRCIITSLRGIGGREVRLKTYSNILCMYVTKCFLLFFFFLG